MYIYRTNLYLDERQAAALADLARSEGVSRAELVRRLLDRCITESAVDLDSDLVAIEESFGVALDVDLAVPRTDDIRAAYLASVASS